MFTWMFILLFLALQVQDACDKLDGKKSFRPTLGHFSIKPHEFKPSLNFLVTKNFLVKGRNFRNPLLSPSPNTAVFLTLFLCGDIELNPGPGNASIYPCGICHNHVGWAPTKGVQCENPQCNLWYHASCISMPSSVYETMDNVSWLCFKCDNFNCDAFTYHAYNVTVGNRYTPLAYSTSDMDHTLNRSYHLLGCHRVIVAQLLGLMAI